MDRDKIMSEIDRLTAMLTELEPDSEKYKSISDRLGDLHDMLIKEDRAIEERSYKNQQIDLEERKLMSENCANADRADQAKKDRWAGIAKVGIGGIISIVLTFLLDENKRESIIDRDLFSVASRWFPKG